MFECPICLLESSDGVCGFACTHTICKSCDAKMQELVQHRCPICRSCRLGYAEFQCDPDAQFNTQFRVLQGMAAAWRLFDNTTASSQPPSDPSVSAIVFPLQPALEMQHAGAPTPTQTAEISTSGCRAVMRGASCRRKESVNGWRTLFACTPRCNGKSKPKPPKRSLHRPLLLFNEDRSAGSFGRLVLEFLWLVIVGLRSKPLSFAVATVSL
jgi:hypothetical protein